MTRHHDRGYCIKIFIGTWIQDSCWKTIKEVKSRKKILLNEGISIRNIKVDEI